MRVAFVTIVFLVACLLTACNGKQKADEAWVDSVMHALDSVPNESVDFTLQEDSVTSVAVDENFNDFLYTFMHNFRFLTQRVQWPVRVMNNAQQQIRTISRGNELKELLSLLDNDYYVMLLNSASQLESDPGSTASVASMKMVNLEDAQIHQFEFSRNSGQWFLTGICVDSFEENNLGSFLAFYNRFVNDSTFQLAHIAQHLNISIPDEDEENAYIEGTIDADQFSLFSPELPSGIFMVVDFDLIDENPHKVVMIKCGFATSMMDVLTFDFDADDWRLIKMEE